MRGIQPPAAVVTPKVPRPTAVAFLVLSPEVQVAPEGRGRTHGWSHRSGSEGKVQLRPDQGHGHGLHGHRVCRLRREERRAGRRGGQGGVAGRDEPTGMSLRLN